MPTQFLQFANHGEPSDVLKLVEQDIAKPRPGQVRVRMLAAAMNPSDLLHIRGQYGQAVKLPARVGFEGVGIVEASGGGLLGRLHLGRRVAVLSKQGGTWGTHCISDAKSVIPIPNSILDEQAASFFVNPATAYLLTKKVLRVPRGEWIMQSAGASAVGRMVIALGKKFGFRTLSLVRQEEQIAELLSLGADVVMRCDGSESAETFRNRVEENCKVLPRFAIDPVGGIVGRLLIEALGKRGHMICYGTLSGEPLLINPRQLMLSQSTISSFWLGPYMEQLSLVTKLQLIRQLTWHHKQKVFELPSVKSFPLLEYQTALSYNQQVKGGHKVIYQWKE